MERLFNWKDYKNSGLIAAETPIDAAVKLFDLGYLYVTVGVEEVSLMGEFFSPQEVVQYINSSSERV